MAPNSVGCCITWDNILSDGDNKGMAEVNVSKNDILPRIKNFMEEVNELEAHWITFDVSTVMKFSGDNFCCCVNMCCLCKM